LRAKTAAILPNLAAAATFAGSVTTTGSSQSWVQSDTTCGPTVWLRDTSAGAWTRYSGITSENSVAVLNDSNGKRCGIINECLLAAVTQQRTRWTQENHRALQTKDAARILAKKS